MRARKPIIKTWKRSFFNRNRISLDKGEFAALLNYVAEAEMLLDTAGERKSELERQVHALHMKLEEEQSVTLRHRPRKFTMPMVYVASPYTTGVPIENVKRSIAVGSELVDMNMCPVLPLLSHFVNELYPKSYGTWMCVDFEKMSRCDAVLVLPGPSSGVEIECALAKGLGIPIVERITANPWREELVKAVGRT